MKTSRIASITYIITLQLLVISPIYAGTYYVSHNGVASWTQARNISTPCSASTAMSNASAGDVVYFRGGVYIVNQAQSYHASLEPSNSGTATNPIIFAAYPNEKPIIDVNLTTEAHYGIGTGGRDWIVWDGFEVYGNGGTKMGGTMVGTNDHISTGLTIKNCVFHGGTYLNTSTDNRELVRVERTANTLIKNCKLYNAQHVNHYHNTSAIKAYDNTNLTIENCEIYNCSNGIYLKRANAYSVVRYNFVHDNYTGLYNDAYEIGGVAHDSPNGKVYHNVFANNYYSSMSFAADDDTGNSDNWAIYNNTIYTTNGRGLSFGNATGWEIYNNILIASINGTGYNLDTSRNASIRICDHNQWGANTFRTRTRLYDSDPKVYYSLAAWKSSGELEEGGDPGFGDLAVDPCFVNSSNKMIRLDDFALKATSPCIRTGRNSANIGADVSLIGSIANGDNTPPTHPSGVTVQPQN